MQQQLINQLREQRYNPPPTTHAGRPKKKDKLPAGSSYTCPVLEEDEDDVEEDSEESDDSGDTDESEDSDDQANTGTSQVKQVPVPVSSSAKRVPASKRVLASKRVPVSKRTPGSKQARFSSDSSDGEERRQDVRKILARFKRKKAQYDRQFAQQAAEESSENGDQPALEHTGQPAQENINQPAQEPTEDQPATNFLPETFVVAVYQDNWYVGEVIAKEGEPEADQREDYVLVSFMERTKGDLLKWPSRLDILNVLKVGTCTLVPVPTVPIFLT
jgi:hypothetical protein